jgi:predicted PurR-regulated permease PerM
MKKIEISHRTIIFTVLFLLFLGFLFLVRDIILGLFVAILIMAILNPLVSRLTRFRIPRAVSILVTYILVFGIFGIAVASILTPLVEETAGFVNNLPYFLGNLGVAKELLGQVVALPGQIFKVGASLFSNLVLTLGSLVFAFYLLLARDKLEEQLVSFFGEEKSRNFGRIIDKLEIKLGGWARGELILMLAIGLATFLGLKLLGIPYALPLAILAGILEIIPTLGPIIAAIPSIIIGLGISPVMGLATAALAFLVHQLENYLLVPKIMEKSVGVTPIATLLSLAIGAKIAGIVGALIAVPILITLQVLLKEYFEKK